MTDYTPDHYASRTYEKMKDVLMDPSAETPFVHYHMIRSHEGNITIWEKGLVGKDNEYVKTYGHYHIGKLDETYRVLCGEGIAIAQLRATDSNGNPIDDEIETAYAVRVKPGDEIYFAPNWGHLVVNTSNGFFATIDDSPVNFGKADEASLPGHADYESVKKMHGFCYYVVEKEGKPTLVKNSLYKKIPEIQIIDLADYPLKK
jgi:oxalate decarboxylase/phosphoglucose isomerase-like protein (cupin superfamily)